MPPLRERIIPEEMKVDTTVHLVLPPEVTKLLNDLHHDRNGIAAGGVILIACLVLLTFKRLTRK